MKLWSNAWIWIGAGFFGSLAIACLVLFAYGAGDRGLHAALAATARFAFLFFWPAYASGALTALGLTAFDVLRRRARELGLAFAAALVVHLGLVAWLSIAIALPAVGVFAIFLPAAVLTFLLALLSIATLQAKLPRLIWSRFRSFAMNYVAFAFLVDFVKIPQPLHIRQGLEYVPFAALVVAGAAARLGAWLKRNPPRLASHIRARSR